MNFIPKWLRRKAPLDSAQPRPKAKPKARKRIDWKGLLGRISDNRVDPFQQRLELKRYEPAPGVVPTQAMDAILAHDLTPYDYFNNQFGLFSYGAFPGYPILAQYSQLPEYRKIVTIWAEEMTRKWISLRAIGQKEKGEDKNARIEIIEKALRKYAVRDVFRKLIEQDGYFGRSQMYVDVKKPSGSLASDDELELKVPLILSPAKIPKGSLVGFRPVEAMWSYPANYNSTQPLKKDYYRPTTWYVMGQSIHASRLITFISRPVPDMLKAAYSFGGISLTQLARPYVENWIRTRDSVSDVVHSFSISGLATDLETQLASIDQQDVLDRIDFFNRMRDNRGCFVLNKDSEEFFQFNTPLSGLDKLQAQAQEQMASVSSIPLVKLTGITPAGLNASSDGEIRVFYDDVHAKQEALMREPLKYAIDLIQLSECGDIDPDIDFIFEPLYQLSELELAQARAAEATADAAYIDKSVVSPQEVRDRIAADPDSPYYNLAEMPDDDLDTSTEEEGEPSERADTTAASSGKA